MKITSQRNDFNSGKSKATMRLEVGNLNYIFIEVWCDGDVFFWNSIRGKSTWGEYAVRVL